MTTILLRIRTINPLNGRRHWRSVWKTGEVEKTRVATMFLLHKARGGTLPGLPVDVKLIRISPHHRGLDLDGCWASMKHVIDQVARELGCPDDGREDLIRFHVEQERGLEHRVRVEMVERVAQERTA